MALETGDYIDDLVITNPTSTDLKSQGDDHLRLLKKVLKQCFPNIDAAVTGTPAQLNVAAAIGALANTDGNFIVGNGSGFVAESGATARTSLGLTDAAVAPYTTGTFTFSVTDPSSNAAGLDNATGYYTRIGKIVHITAVVDINSISGMSGAVKVTGLPFKMGDTNVTAEAGALAIPYPTTSSAVQHICAFMFGGSTNALLYRVADAASTMATLSAAEMGGSAFLILAGTYWTAAA